MAQQNLSYLTFELAILFAAWLVVYSLGGARTLLTRRFLVTTLGLSLLWIGWDVVAVFLGVFRFPRDGSLPMRIFGLPIEELLFFPMHVTVVWSVVLSCESANPVGEDS